MKILIAIYLAIIFFPLNLMANVFIDQEGYPGEAAKYVFVSQAADNFDIRDASSNVIVYSGSLTLFKDYDPATGLTIYRGDFSDFQTGGEFYIEVDGAGSSETFPIA